MNEMKSGTGPTTLDKRDYSFNRTFGQVAPSQLPKEYSVDSGLTMPDQTREGNPYSCTAYSVCDYSTDQDGKIYNEEYQYMKTLFMQGLPPETNGSDLRSALKVPRVYGLLPDKDFPESLKGKGEDYTANQSHWPEGLETISGLLEHRKGNFFNIYDDGVLDWFDSVRSAMWQNRVDKRGAIIGTPWFPEWRSPQNGVLNSQFIYRGARAHLWHAYCIKGWKEINGKEYLIVKPWIGKNYGDKGFAYLSRETFNKVMEIRGSVAFTLADAKPGDIRSIQLDIFEHVMHLLARIIGMFTSKLVRLN